MLEYPKPGQIYYHFKRNPEKGLENGAYLILGVGKNTENRDIDFVVTKPLYFCDPRQPDEKNVSYLLRPVQNFFDNIDRPNYTGPRFWLVTDPETISYLKKTFLYTSQYLDE